MLCAFRKCDTDLKEKGKVPLLGPILNSYMKFFLKGKYCININVELALKSKTSQELQKKH